MSDLRAEFHHNIDALRNDIALLGATVIELIPQVTEILLNQDLEGAERVLEGDDEIDARSIDIEERALTMLALQAPMATDLRQLAAGLKLAPEIERSADLCCNICKAARRIVGHDIDPTLRGLIQRMSDQARLEYQQSIDAYIAVDAVRSAAQRDMDDYLDDLHRQFVQQILESHAAGNIDLDVAIQLAVVARFYERLGDHSVNISNRVTYIATGWLPQHEAAERHRARQLENEASGADG